MVNNSEVLQDLCYRLYTETLSTHHSRANSATDKLNFLAEALKLFSEIEVVKCSIMIKTVTVIFKFNSRRYTFWSVEMPEIDDKNAFVKYLSHHLKDIYSDCNNID
ncbi:hypothetical protein HCY02_07080 [Acinetobacter radioresistens]|nr:hypothetical protein DOM24_07335 [Acinetobacter radioresistens]MCK4090852.1 hypothetical protein [Acinetobacter radioresistens]MCK4102031.1 hypothetical protein [Acinetobacter radioresistens]